VAATPILAVAGPWLYLRARFFRRKWTVITLASTPAANSCWRCARWRAGRCALAAVSMARWAPGAARILPPCAAGGHRAAIHSLQQVEHPARQQSSGGGVGQKRR
jgi:hypothetical protein